jgi:hypothetical protein
VGHSRVFLTNPRIRSQGKNYDTDMGSEGRRSSIWHQVTDPKCSRVCRRADEDLDEGGEESTTRGAELAEPQSRRNGPNVSHSVTKERPRSIGLVIGHATLSYATTLGTLAVTKRQGSINLVEKWRSHI